MEGEWGKGDCGKVRDVCSRSGQDDGVYMDEALPDTPFPMGYFQVGTARKGTGLGQGSVTDAPINSQHKVTRPGPVVPSPLTWDASLDSLDCPLGRTITVNPSLPSTASLPKVATASANQDRLLTLVLCLSIEQCQLSTRLLYQISATHSRLRNSCMIQRDDIKPCHFKLIKSQAWLSSASGTA